MTNLYEALRYAGVTHPDENMLRRMEETAAQLEKSVQPRLVWRTFTLERKEDGFVLGSGGICLTGATAEKMLSECTQAVLMACTLGTAFDTLLRTEQRRGMDRALLMDACGSAMIEGVCNDAEQEIAARFPDLYLTDRFSPGYGDLPLSLQPKLLDALDAGRRTGITILPSLLMNPAKSVTAVIGLSGTPQAAKIRGCTFCRMRGNCSYRKGGQTCGS